MLRKKEVLTFQQARVLLLDDTTSQARLLPELSRNSVRLIHVITLEKALKTLSDEQFSHVIISGNHDPNLLEKLQKANISLAQIILLAYKKPELPDNLYIRFIDKRDFDRGNISPRDLLR